MSVIEELAQKLKNIEDERSKIFAQIKPLQEKASVLYAEMTLIKEDITKATLLLEQSEQERFDFLMEEKGHGTDEIRYRAAEKFIRSLGLYMSGYNPFSEQKSSDVFIFKHDAERNEQSIESLKKLVELYKPMDSHGNKKFRVFCQDYYIVFTANKTIELTGRYMTSKEFPTIEALFEHYVAHCECYDAEETESDD
jgi:hypothetical protein